jgi:hypothetical protein
MFANRGFPAFALMLAIYAVGREGHDAQPFQRNLLATLVADAVEPTTKSLESVIQNCLS